MIVTTIATFEKDIDGFSGEFSFTREIEDVYEFLDYSGDVGRGLGFTYLAEMVGLDEDGKAINKVF